MADLVYSKQFPQSPWITKAFLPAFALEVGFYLASVFLETRNWFASFRPVRAQAALLWLSALLPYIIFSLRAGTFHRNAFYLLVGISAVFSFWHAILPRRAAYDFGFLVIAAAPIITRAFSRIYLAPDRHLPADILGKLMWIRLGLIALLVVREWNPGAFGIWPTLLEWRAGALYYAAAIVPLALIALGVHDVRWAPLSGAWWRVSGVAIGTFFGFLWVTALSEELFFRGVITRALLTSLPSRALAIGLSAILFGACHLWFRGFPDWREAIVASALGIVCATAFARTNSVRVSMVTHTLMVTTWRLFFRL